MQVPIILHKGQARPWSSIPRINWGHPLTRGLIFYGYDTGSGYVVDLVHGQTTSLLNSPNPPNKPSRFGSGLNYANAGGSRIFPVNATVNTVMGSGAFYSIASAWFLTTLPTAGTFAGPFGFSEGGSTTDNTILLAASASGDMQWSIGNVNPTPFSGNTANAYHTFVGTNTSATAQNLYFDGVLATTTALATDVITTTAQAAFNTNSASAGGGNNIVGFVYYGAMWNRTITAAEAFQLHQDPYCFLIYPEDEMFSTLVGVTGTTPTGFWNQFEPPVRRVSPRIYQESTIGTPPKQVFFPYDRWPERLLRAAPPTESPSTVLGAKPAQVFFPYDRWPERLLRAPPPTDAQFVLGAKPAQVFFPYDRWPDRLVRPSPSAEFPQPVTPIVQTTPFTWSTTSYYTDFATGAKRVVEFPASAHFPFDGVLVSATGTATHNAASATQDFTFTVNVGDTLAVFFLAVDSGAGGNAINSVVWDSTGTQQACTQIASQVCSTLTNGIIAAFGCVNPRPGTFTLEVKQTLSIGMTAELQSYTRTVNTSMAAAVTQASGVATSNQTMTAPTLTGAMGDMNVAAYITPGTFTSNSDTLIYSQSAAGKPSLANRFLSFGSGHALFAKQNAVQSAALITFNIVYQQTPFIWNVTGTPFPDTIIRARPVIQYPDLAYVQTPITPALTWSLTGAYPDFAPSAKRIIEFPAFAYGGTQPPQVFFPYDRWADTAPAAKRDAWFQDLTFPFQTPPQVFFPYDRWADTAPAAKRTVQFQDLTFPFQTPPQVFFPYDRWVDTAPAARRTPWFQDLVYPYQTIVPGVTYTQWTQWPDFLLRAKAVPDFIPWTFIPSPAQVFFPYDRWADRAPRAPSAADFPALAFPFQTPPQVFTPYDRWPERLLRPAPTVQFPDLGLVQVVVPPSVTNFSWLQWPDFAPKSRVVADILPWRFIPPPAQVWFPWDRWPELLLPAKRAAEYPAFTIGNKPIQVFFPFDRWPDYIWKKKEPLNYEPLAPTFQPIKIFFSQWTQWPEFAVLRDKLGPHASKQPALFFWPGIVPQAPVTAAMLAFEIDTDGMIMAINVIPGIGGPAASAIVGITETGT